MAKGLPFIQFYPADWCEDPVAGCSLAAQGLWLRMMFLMHSSERYGYLCQNGSPIPPGSVAQRCGCTPEQYESLRAELSTAGVPSQSEEGIIFSRRMVRDALRREKARRFGKRGGNPLLLNGGVNPPVNLTSDICTLPDSLKTKEFQEAWDLWLTHRAQKKSKLTEVSRKQQLAKCAAMGPERAARMVMHSIEQGWTGMYEPSENGKAPAKVDAQKKRLESLQ